MSITKAVDTNDPSSIELEKLSIMLLETLFSNKRQIQEAAAAEKSEELNAIQNMKDAEEAERDALKQLEVILAAVESENEITFENDNADIVASLTTMVNDATENMRKVNNKTKDEIDKAFKDKDRQIAEHKSMLLEVQQADAKVKEALREATLLEKEFNIAKEKSQIDLEKNESDLYIEDIDETQAEEVLDGALNEEVNIKYIYETEAEEVFDEVPNEEIDTTRIGEIESVQLLDRTSNEVCKKLKFNAQWRGSYRCRGNRSYLVCIAQMAKMIQIRAICVNNSIEVSICKTIESTEPLSSISLKDIATKYVDTLTNTSKDTQLVPTIKHLSGSADVDIAVSNLSATWRGCHLFGSELYLIVATQNDDTVSLRIVNVSNSAAISILKNLENNNTLSIESLKDIACAATYNYSSEVTPRSLKIRDISSSSSSWRGICLSRQNEIYACTVTKNECKIRVTCICIRNSTTLITSKIHKSKQYLSATSLMKMAMKVIRSPPKAPRLLQNVPKYRNKTSQEAKKKAILYQSKLKALAGLQKLKEKDKAVEAARKAESDLKEKMEQLKKKELAMEKAREETERRKQHQIEQQRLALYEAQKYAIACASVIARQAATSTDKFARESMRSLYDAAIEDARVKKVKAEKTRKYRELVRRAAAKRASENAILEAAEEAKWNAFIENAVVADESWDILEQKLLEDQGKLRRIDDSDGNAYTKEEMVTFYGGTYEWDHARGENENEVEWQARLDRIDAAAKRRQFRRLQKEQEESRRQEEERKKNELREARIREAKKAKELLRRKEEEAKFWKAKEEADRIVRERQAKEAEARRLAKEAKDAEIAERERILELERIANEKRRLQKEEEEREDLELKNREEEKMRVFQEQQKSRLAKADAALKAKEKENNAKIEAAARAKKRKEIREKLRREDEEKQKRKEELEKIRLLEAEAEATRRAMLTTGERRKEDLKKALKEGASFAKIKQGLQTMKESIRKAEEDAAAAKVKAAEEAMLEEARQAQAYFEARRLDNEKKRLREKEALALKNELDAMHKEKISRYEKDTEMHLAFKLEQQHKFTSYREKKNKFEKNIKQLYEETLNQVMVDIYRKLEKKETNRRSSVTLDQESLCINQKKAFIHSLNSNKNKIPKRRGSKNYRWLDILSSNGVPEDGNRVHVEVLQYRKPGQKHNDPKSVLVTEDLIDGGAAQVNVLDTNSSQMCDIVGLTEWVSLRNLWHMKAGGLRGPPGKDTLIWMDVLDDSEHGGKVGRIPVKVLQSGTIERKNARIEIIPGERAHRYGFQGGENAWVSYDHLWLQQAGITRMLSDILQSPRKIKTVSESTSTRLPPIEASKPLPLQKVPDINTGTNTKLGRHSKKEKIEKVTKAITHSKPLKLQSPKLFLSGVHKLFGAATVGNDKAIRRLIAIGVSINSRDPNGSNCTALHICANRGHVIASNVLLHLGIAVNAINTRGDTALHTAVTSRIIETFSEEAKLSNCGPTFSKREKIYDHNSVKICRLLLLRGANVNAKSKDGCTPLHRAAFYGLGSEGIILLQNGARVRVRDQWNRTALETAKAFAVNNNTTGKIYNQWIVFMDLLNKQNRREKGELVGNDTLKVGEKVLARFRGLIPWVRGEVVQVIQNKDDVSPSKNCFDILYQNGKTENSVHRRLILRDLNINKKDNKDPIQSYMRDSKNDSKRHRKRLSRINQEMDKLRSELQHLVKDNIIAESKLKKKEKNVDTQRLLQKAKRREK